ncbi:acyl-CoA thioesterase-1 [Desulfocicer vacuolatum DSM 3385]|uniref:Acyl-CoA thioesterase-1 n=1 Tax=Desulfocicer vacuolatum DSM 3385 TaxID=1121400 RepID=A0A1W2ED36_9BACT|nr:arylesterase [Desulfocicer vacuolatum]SMD07567.1 acyl-CoA thioesterase-1 [Desulfocicer vacuolatum DSM 3385]
MPLKSLSLQRYVGALLLLLFAMTISPSLLKAETTIVFLGDSLTAGYGVDSREAFPSLLAPLLSARGYNDVKLINAGISGSTTASALSRLKWYQRVKPDILFLALGANDGLRGLSTTAMATHLEETIKLAISSGMTIILAGMEIPPNYGSDYTQRFRKVFPVLAEKYPIVFMPFLLKDVAGLSKYNQVDGIHPNKKGHAIVAANVIPYVVTALNLIDAPPKNQN